MKLFHKINKTEINYGILNLRKRDGTKSFFLNLPGSFTMIFKNEKLFSRNIHTESVWIGVSITKKLILGEVVEITEQNGIVHVA
jgi:hypothetical protein